MKLQTADDVQLLVEDFGWHIQDLQTHEIVFNLETMNNTDLKLALNRISERLWDETFDDQMGALAKLHALKQFEDTNKAIKLWQKECSK